MTKNKKIKLLSNEVKTLQQKLNRLSKTENNKTAGLLEDYNKNISHIINELELEKMQYKNLREEIEKSKNKYEMLYHNIFKKFKKRKLGL
jgi:hypothetical protein